MRLDLFTVLSVVLFFPTTSFAQQDLPKLGIGVKASTLGIGIEAATAVTARSNLRGGFNFFDYDRTFDDDGIDYSGTLNFRSVQLMYDQYLIGGFHISPGILLHNGNKGTATATVEAGRTFTLGSVTYFSNTTDPIKGGATVDFRNVAPMIVVGFGNLLPRSDRRFGVNFDAGIAFQGSPNLKLNLSGTACITGPTTNCANAATDPTVQSNIRNQEAKLNDDSKAFKYYPVVSIGVSWKIR